MGLGLLTLEQLAFLLVTVEYTQLRPVPSPAGDVFLPGFSLVKQTVFYWAWAFFQFMGRGFFVLAIYLGLVAMTWGRPAPGIAAGRVGRNDPCPCGSGLKAKRCCGA